jgi:hypothetical protein
VPLTRRVYRVHNLNVCRFKHAFLHVVRDHKSVIPITYTTQRMFRRVQQMSKANICTMC